MRIWFVPKAHGISLKSSSYTHKYLFFLMKKYEAEQGFTRPNSRVH